MIEIWQPFLFASQFIPHGHCYLWQPTLVSLHIVSDLVTALAYYSIPVMLIYFVRQRCELPFPSIFWLFGVLIAASGTTHLMAIWTIWHPTYWLSGAIKVITAIVSLYTALELYPVIPQALALPSLEEINDMNQEKERLVLSLQAAKTAAWDWDIPSDKVIWNSEHEIIFGYEPGKPQRTYGDWKSRVHPEDLSKVEAIIQTGMDNHQEEFTYQYRIVWPDGSIHWVDAFGRFIWETGEKPIRMVGILNDITDRKQAQEALKESEERFRATFEQAAVGMAHVSLDGRWMRVNEKLCEITGYRREELLARTFQSITHPDDLDTDLKLASKLLAGNISNYSLEKRYIRKDGTEIWVNITISLMYDTFNPTKPKHFIAVVEDISGRKEVEKKLKELNQTLTQTTDLLKQRNQELDGFVYIVSHDLKAPLRAIANLSQWIEDDLNEQIPEENQQQLRLLRQRVYRMEEMINGLLNYSRAGRTKVNIENVNLKNLLEEVIDSIAPPTTFNIEMPPQTPIISTKKLLLSQVFANLISNAIKHHDRPDGTIQINVQDQGNAYEFAVSDDGPGIAPENQEKIFAIFQTLKAKDTNENTGIGLSIVKKIVETEGGVIMLKSYLGQGSTFRFTWPKSGEGMRGRGGEGMRG